ncbi:IclR family transcriptional regulator [Jhaorihella thermophila]
MNRPRLHEPGSGEPGGEAAPEAAPAAGQHAVQGAADPRDARNGAGAQGVSELARELGLTKSNVFRLLQTLVALGYVQATEDKLYRATLKTWRVGRAVVENVNLRDLAAPAMEVLARETGETIYLAVQEGLSVVYIDKVESTRPIRSWNPIGGHRAAALRGHGQGDPGRAL